MPLSYSMTFVSSQIVATIANKRHTACKQNMQTKKETVQIKNRNYANNEENM